MGVKVKVIVIFVKEEIEEFVIYSKRYGRNIIDVG